MEFYFSLCSWTVHHIPDFLFLICLKQLKGRFTEMFL